MANISLSDGTLYLEILIGIAALGLAGLFYLGLRRMVNKFRAGEPGGGGYFLLRLGLPGIMGLISLVLGSRPVRQVLSVRQPFFEFLHAIFVFSVILFLIRFIDALFQAWFSRRKAPFPVPRVLHGFILAVIYLALVFMILRGILGINITPFLATSAILTAILGLALQGVLSNILAGLSLHFTRSFGRGDWVKVGATEGVVMDMNWRETRILDRASNMIILPNNVMASETITNFSQPDKKSAITISLKVGFEVPPARVLESLKEAAAEDPEVLKTPSPLAYILSYDDLGISYLLKFWIQNFSRKHDITTNVGRLVWYKFKRRGIEVPVPVAGQVTRFIQAVDKEGKSSALDRELERTCLDLIRSPLFKFHEGERAGAMILSDAENRMLASLIRRQSYTSGEVLFRQGEKGESCYVVISGCVRGQIISVENGKKYSSEFQIGPGGIVGEMSLFTGMPRTATVTVVEESELLEIGAAAFAEVLARNPTLAEAVAETVSRRNAQNLEALRKIKELSAQDVEAGSSKKSVLEYLRKLVKVFKH